MQLHSSRPSLLVIFIFILSIGLMGCSRNERDLETGEGYEEDSLEAVEIEDNYPIIDTLITPDMLEAHTKTTTQTPPTRFTPPGYSFSYIPPANFANRKGIFSSQDYIAEYSMDKESSTDNFTENMKVSGWPEEISDFNAYFAGEIAGVEAMDLYTLIDTSSQTTPEGIRYKRWQMRSKFDIIGIISETVTYVYHEDGYTYMIQGTSTDEDFNRFKEIFDEVGASFRLE